MKCLRWKRRFLSKVFCNMWTNRNDLEMNHARTVFTLFLWKYYLYDRKEKTEILPSFSRVSRIVWFHDLGSWQTIGEKAKEEIQRCFVLFLRYHGRSTQTNSCFNTTYLYTNHPKKTYWSLDCRIYRLLLCRGVRNPSTNVLIWL